MSFQLIVYASIKITNRYTALLYNFAAKQQKEEHKPGVKNFCMKIKYKQVWACKKYRNKAAMKTQEDYPATENLW